MIFLLSPGAYSSSFIESEFELALPRQFQQSLIEQRWKSLAAETFKTSWQFPDQVIEASRGAQQGIKVNLQGISLSLQTQLRKPDLVPDPANLQLQSKDLQAQLLISEISVNQTIEQMVGGITGHFHIQAQCKNVILNMRPGMGSFGLILKPAVAGTEVAAELQKADLSWQPQAWQTGNISCIGVEGFADLVKQELQKISADSKSFLAPHKEQIISSVKQSLGKFTLDLAKPRQLISSRSDIKMNMVIDSFDDSKVAQILARGRITLEFTRSSQTGTKKIIFPTAMGNEVETPQATLRLPGDFIKEVMTQAYSANSWVYKLYSTSLPGFSTLMSSRFSQFFVWPALMNYPKASKFLFSFYSNKDPKVTGQGTQYQVNMNLFSQMQAPQGGSYIPFMSFGIPFTSKVNLAVSSGQSISQLKVSFKNTALILQPHWITSYVNRFAPPEHFGASTIQSRILGALVGKSMVINLPTIPLGEGLLLQIKKAQSLPNSDLLLQLAP